MKAFAYELIGGPFDGHRGTLAGEVREGMTAIFHDVANDGDRWAYAPESMETHEIHNGLWLYKMKVVCRVASADAKKGGGQ